MSPTSIERRHYAKLAGRTIKQAFIGPVEGQLYPVLVLERIEGEFADPEVMVWSDAEGNGPGFLDHGLE